MKESYVDPKSKDAHFNSCTNPHLKIADVCSGRGSCLPFGDTGVSFCRCNPGFGGAECESKRKSQITAWFLCLFLGPLGADQYYLGWYPEMLITQLLSVLGVALLMVVPNSKLPGGEPTARFRQLQCDTMTAKSHLKSAYFLRLRQFGAETHMRHIRHTDIVLGFGFTIVSCFALLLYSVLLLFLILLLYTVLLNYCRLWRENGISSILAPGLVVLLGPWMRHVVIIGSAPAQGIGDRTSADLPRCAFVAFSMLWHGLEDWWYSSLLDRLWMWNRVARFLYTAYMRAHFLKVIPMHCMYANYVL